MNTTHQITPSEVEQWGITYLNLNASFKWFADVLNGKYSVEKAKEDCLTHIELLKGERNEK